MQCAGQLGKRRRQWRRGDCCSLHRYGIGKILKSCSVSCQYCTSFLMSLLIYKFKCFELLHYHFLTIKSILKFLTSNQGAGKRPRQCCHPKGGNGAEGPKGPRTKGTATRGPEGPESGQNMRVRGPEGPEDEQS